LIGRHVLHALAESGDAAFFAEEIHPHSFEGSFILRGLNGSEGFDFERVELREHGQMGRADEWSGRQRKCRQVVGASQRAAMMGGVALFRNPELWSKKTMAVQVGQWLSASIFHNAARQGSPCAFLQAGSSLPPTL